MLIVNIKEKGNNEEDKGSSWKMNLVDSSTIFPFSGLEVDSIRPSPKKRIEKFLNDEIKI